MNSLQSQDLNLGRSDCHHKCKCFKFIYEKINTHESVFL